MEESKREYVRASFAASMDNLKGGLDRYVLVMLGYSVDPLTYLS